MAWSYSGDPASSLRDEVRFIIGDTVSADPLLQDAEVNYCIAQEPNKYLAAALCCDAVSKLYSRLADASIGDVHQSMSQKSAQYRAAATDLRVRAMASAIPGFGGISQSAKDLLNSDTDAVSPTFAKGMDDIPGAPNGIVPASAGDPFLDFE